MPATWQAKSGEFSPATWQARSGEFSPATWQARSGEFLWMEFGTWKSGKHNGIGHVKEQKQNGIGHVKEQKQNWIGRIKREGKNRIEGGAFLKEQAGKEEGSGCAPEDLHWSFWSSMALQCTATKIRTYALKLEP